MRMLLVGLITALLLAPAAAEEEPVFRIEFKDGVINRARLDVPASRRLKIELHNVGDSPAEFESLELHKETVLPPNGSTSLVIRTLEPGAYRFFDFHPADGALDASTRRRPQARTRGGARSRHRPIAPVGRVSAGAGRGRTRRRRDRGVSPRDARGRPRGACRWPGR